MEHLLSPENVEIVEADERRDHRQASLPAVAFRVVPGVELPHVVGSRREGLRSGGEGRCGRSGAKKDEQFLHISFFRFVSRFIPNPASGP